MVARKKVKGADSPKESLSRQSESKSESKVQKTARVVSSTRGVFVNIASVLVLACVAMTAQIYLQKYYPDSVLNQTLVPLTKIVQSWMPESPPALPSALKHDTPAVPKTDSVAEKTAGVINDKKESKNADEGAKEELIPGGATPDGRPPEVSHLVCKDRHEECVGFANAGECTNNPGWMIMNCASSCDACHLRDPKVRCARDRLGIKEDPVYAPGDMEAMFSSIEKTYGTRYGVNVLSRDPWVVTFDNFLTDQEVDALIYSVNHNWERSTDTGTSNEFGESGRVLSSGRTSNNAWCRKECNENPYVQNILKKIEEIVWVPQVNYEAFQVLRYEIGQLYKPHHDASPGQAKLPCGPRILTFFLYLSDVDEGGETAFPQLDIAVTPKKGKALLWPSTLDQHPMGIDARTIHEARPVLAGTKFAANTWIHSHDYTYSNLMGCTGTFDELSK